MASSSASSASFPFDSVGLDDCEGAVWTREANSATLESTGGVGGLMLRRDDFRDSVRRRVLLVLTSLLFLRWAWWFSLFSQYVIVGNEGQSERDVTCCDVAALRYLLVNDHGLHCVSARIKIPNQRL